MDSKDSKELQQEQADLLRRLRRRPAWDLYRTRLQQLLQEREREKAVHLRKGDAQRAIVTQGQADGILEALGLIDKIIQEVSSAVDEPAY